jgi:cellulose synthase operon protein C
MILLFPDIDTLKLALSSSIVGPDVTLAPAVLTIDSQGRLYVEPKTTLSRTTTKNLDRIGVKGCKRHGSSTPEPVANWLQIVPLQKEPGPPELSSQSPVLFELESADDLPVLVSEMLRLGNDRQSFRWFQLEEEGRVLLRVLGPPYYTLLRALDQTASGTRGTVRAYLERAPRVWVEIGHNHPFASQMRAPETQLLLVRPPRHWLFLDEAPFQDIYDLLQFQLPKIPTDWNETNPPEKMTVPLKLAAGNAADVPELWVLRDDAIDQLDALVRDADDRLTQRLTFAIAVDSNGQRIAVLRTRPSKLPPPALPLENALGFKPFWKLPNLFVPAGRRLHPTLRRDAVRRLLADDPDQVVWLNPGLKGEFTPERVPDSAFRSLEDWVDYVIEMEQAPLAAWIAATRFDFDSFICQEPNGPKPKADAPDKEAVAKTDEMKLKAAVPPKPPRGKASAAGAKAELLPPPEPQPISAWRIQREGLEEKFLAVEGSLDDPARRALWPQLAEANAGEGSPTEAAICWLNALWSVEEKSPTRQQGSADLAAASASESLSRWVRAEFPDAGASLEPKDLDRRLGIKMPSVEDARAVAVGFLWLADQNPTPPWLPPRLPDLQKYFEMHEAAMPVRAVWLAAVAMARLSGHDVLGLARVRDRLLLRLLEEGLRAERDLPLFLRYAGLKDSARLRIVRDKALELHQAARKWVAPAPVNLPYIDLLFAFALARLGESTAAKRLLDEARQAMEVPLREPIADLAEEQPAVAAITSNYLYKAYRYRVDQALAGKPPRDPLAESLLVELDAIRAKARSEEFFFTAPRGQKANPFAGAEYNIARMREQSRILEPQGSQNPYITTGRQSDPVAKALGDLQSQREPSRRRDLVRRLYRQGVPGEDLGEVRLKVLLDELPRSPRDGERYTVELLEYVLALLDPSTAAKNKDDYPDTSKRQGELLERSLFLAGHFDRGDIIQKLVSRFVALVKSRPERAQHTLIKHVARQSLQSLRKMGLRDDIDRLLSQIQDVILPGITLDDVRLRYENQPAANWFTALQTLLNLASGWLTFGWGERAEPILDTARSELKPRARGALTQDYIDLTRSYIRVLGQDCSERGLARIAEAFAIIPADRIPNTYTTSPYFSRFHLNIVEEVILALVSDEFALGPAGRRWLDEDEYIVRARIHADMRRAVPSSEEL